MTDSRKHIVGPTERREEIARIIAPNDWLSTEEREARAVASTSTGDAYGWRLPPNRKPSLAKADAILASDGGREMARELVEALGRLLSIARMEWRTERVDDARKAARMAHAKAKEWLEGKG